MGWGWGGSYTYILQLLTHALELVLELCLVVAFGDVEVEIGVILLEEDVGRDGRAKGKHSGGAIRTLHNPSRPSLHGGSVGVVKVVVMGSHCEE